MNQDVLEDEFESDSVTSSYAWMLTFSDLLLLLLTLFVLKLSMSSLDGNTLQRALSSYIMGAETNQRPGGSRSGNELQIEDVRLAATSERILTAIRDGLASLSGETQGKRESGGGEKVLSDSIDISILESGIALRLPSVFPNQGVEMSYRAAEQLKVIAKSVEGENVRILLTAHASGKLPLDAPFPSLWELTAAQAESVSRQMIDAGVGAQSISLFGYGKSKPLLEERGESADYQNRRVEILVTPLGN